jgi:hypothetical protein
MAITGPIIGARIPEQLADNLGATGWVLDDDQLRRLTRGRRPAAALPLRTATTAPIRSPYGLIADACFKSFVVWLPREATSGT